MLNTEMMFAPGGQVQMHAIQGALQRALKDERPIVRLTALQKLTAMSNPEAVDLLAETLREPRNKLFSPLQAIQGLMAAHRATAHADLIRKHLRDKDPALRASAVSALASDPPSRETILQLLVNREEPYEVRSTSLGVLTRGGDGAARPALRVAVDRAEDPRLRAEAVAALGVAARTAESGLSIAEASEVVEALEKLGPEDADRIGPVVERTLRDAKALVNQHRER